MPSFITPRYRILDLLGQGAMGEVYRAQDLQLRRWVAIKVLSAAMMSPHLCDRFAQEATIAAQLGDRSPHIVRVHDFGVDERDRPFYVMEYLAGTSLRQILKSQPLSQSRFLTYARQICLGLHCAHQGIARTLRELDGDPAALSAVIHRDIKPSNIMVTPAATTGELVKILDFGISQVLQAEADTTGLYMGTMAYSAPEQLSAEALDVRSDIYSLGVLLFEMLTGRLPLYADQAGSLVSWYKAHQFQTPLSFAQAQPDRQLPRSLESLILSCLAKSPGDRPASVLDILNVMAAVPPGDDVAPGQLDPQTPSRLGDGMPTIATPASASPAAFGSEAAVSLSWPQTQPIAPIAFAQFDATGPNPGPAVWAMRSHQAIQTLQIYKLYNQTYQNFLYCASPHPTLMWLTAIHNHRQRTQWFNCFLDLKAPLGKRLVYRLIAQQQYAVLLFDLEAPHGYTHSFQLELKAAQRSQLQQWLVLSQGQRGTGALRESQRILQAEFERIRPAVEADLAR